MKNLLILGLIVAVGYLLFKRTPDGSTAFDGPVKSMEQRVSQFPRSIHFQDGDWQELVDVRYNVKKTDSLSAPVIGLVYFTRRLSFANLDYEISFHWQEGAWVLNDFQCLDREYSASVSALLNSPELHTWIVRGAVSPDEVTAQTTRLQAEETKRRQAEFDRLVKWDNFGKPINRVPPPGLVATANIPPAPLGTYGNPIGGAVRAATPKPSGQRYNAYGTTLDGR